MTLKMGAARNLRNGIIPPAKEVHYFSYGRKADSVRSFHAHSPTGLRNIENTDYFLPDFSVAMQKIVIRRSDSGSLLCTLKISIRPAHDRNGVFQIVLEQCSKFLVDCNSTTGKAEMIFQPACQFRD